MQSTDRRRLATLSLLTLSLLASPARGDLAPMPREREAGKQAVPAPQIPPPAPIAQPAPIAPPAPITAPPPAPPAPPPLTDKPEASLYDTPAAALAAIVARAEQDAGQPPRVVAFGEYHETIKNGGVPSALKRFTLQLLPVLQPLTSDLVLETWITEGGCGKEEKAVVKDVEKTTQRPVTTEDELVTLAKQAKASGVQPHILNLSCKDYQELLDGKGQVDYEKMLKFLAEQLHKKVVTIGKARADKGVSKIVAVYGGALHNDLYPQEELRPFTFGPTADAAAPGRYLEVDLYVPEFITNDESLRAQPFFAVWRKAQRPGKTVVVRRGPRSFILLFPVTPKSAKKALVRP